MLSTSSSSTSTSRTSSPLKDILDEAVGLATQEEEQEETQMDDVFASLFKAFAPQPAVVCDPFEPTPMMMPVSNILEPTPLPEVTSDEGSYGSIQDDWEPFPLIL